MSKGRMEAFSDGVLAIIITIMVLELAVPHGSQFSALKSLIPIFLSYVLSFAIIGTYWNNHHHLLQASSQVDGRVLWANLHLLFWLSLTPFATGWMGVTNFAPSSVALYGTVQFLAAVAYFLLAQALIALHGRDSVLANALGRDVKGKVSLVIFLIAVPLTLLSAWASLGLYVFGAVLWLVPDRRIERTLTRTAGSDAAE